MPINPSSAFAAVVFSAVFVCGTALALPQNDDNKISNHPSDLKAALKAAGMTSTTSDLPSAMANTKIAALDTTELKADAVQPTLAGDMAQGGLVIGQTRPGSIVKLDDIRVDVDDEGRFIFGFGRDHPDTAVLNITYGDGTILPPKVLKIASREFKEQRIDNLPSNKVDEFTPEELKKITEGTAKKNAARANMQQKADWVSGFDWPVTGTITGLFGSRRILNGVPRRPHSGVDVGAVEGTDVRAPADGVITLADPDMYFEGGLVFIDHGQGLESALMHMSRLDVVAGQRVTRGDIIGAVGATGRATGPHMHWSLKWKSRLLDAQLVAPEMPET